MIIGKDDHGPSLALGSGQLSGLRQSPGFARSVGGQRKDVSEQENDAWRICST
jgi:hypothetical protein